MSHSDTLLESIDLKDGRRLEIRMDSDPLNPRVDYDNVGKMICFHKRYTLGDKHELKERDFTGWKELAEYLTTEFKAKLIHPLYLYDHSGLTISMGKFSCPWDSGQVGFIYCTQEDIDKEWRGDVQAAERYLEGEVKIYDQYLQGLIYGFILMPAQVECPTCHHKERKGDEDSCWGFFGDDWEESGILDHLPKDVVEELRVMGKIKDEEAMPCPS
jgi:hypothetical protein